MKKNSQYAECANRPEIIDRGMFPNNTDLVEADIYKGGVFLGCEFGLVALYG
jgi:natural resistance-associated macrophage protein